MNSKVDDLSKKIILEAANPDLMFERTSILNWMKTQKHKLGKLIMGKDKKSKEFREEFIRCMKDLLQMKKGELKNKPGKPSSRVWEKTFKTKDDDETIHVRIVLGSLKFANGETKEKVNVDVTVDDEKFTYPVMITWDADRMKDYFLEKIGYDELLSDDVSGDEEKEDKPEEPTPEEKKREQRNRRYKYKNAETYAFENFNEEGTNAINNIWRRKVKIGASEAVLEIKRVNPNIDETNTYEVKLGNRSATVDISISDVKSSEDIKDAIADEFTEDKTTLFGNPS